MYTTCRQTFACILYTCSLHFVLQNVYKILSKCSIHFAYKHFVYILYTKVCRNVGYILYTNILYAFCIQTVYKSLPKCGIHFYTSILYTFCIHQLQYTKSVHHQHFVYNLHAKFIHNVYINNCMQNGFLISTTYFFLRLAYQTCVQQIRHIIHNHKAFQK